MADPRQRFGIADVESVAEQGRASEGGICGERSASEGGVK